MNYQVQWVIPNRAVFVHIADRLSAEEGRAMNSAIREYIEIGEAPVHVIMDLRHTNLDVSSLGNAKSFFIMDKSPKLGWSILISNDKMIRFTSAIIAENAGLDIRLTESPRNALAFLIDMEPELGSLDDALTVINKIDGAR